MATILHIETSASICSVALSSNGRQIGIMESNDDKSHARLLMPFVEQILNENQLKVQDIDAIAVSEGPGSYTGLRIGVSAAKGLAYAADKPLIAVNTQRAMAHYVAQNLQSLIYDMNLNSKDITLICSLSDARRTEVYSSVYNLANEIVIEISPMMLNENSYSDILDKTKVVFCGDGANKTQQIVNHKNAIFLADILPSASFMIPLSEQCFNEKNFKDIAYFEPFYLKDFVATISKKNQF